MKETYNINSLSAYLNLPDIGRKQAQVFGAIIELGIASDKEICEYLRKEYPEEKWEINRVPNRRGELKAKGIIIEAEGDFYNEGGRQVDKYRPKKIDDIFTKIEPTRNNIRPEVKQKLEEQRVNEKLL